MVVGWIAEHPDVAMTVLTRDVAGSPRTEDYPALRVRRFRNPTPDRWKDYAAGWTSVSFLARAAVVCTDMFLSLPDAIRLARTHNLVHVHFTLPFGITALLARRATGRPVIVTVHGNADTYEIPRVLYGVTRWVLENSDTVVCVSEDLAHVLARDIGVTRPLHIIQNGVDVHRFAPAPRDDGLNLVTVSRLVPRKNVDVLIESVRRVHEEGVADLRLRIVGTGPEEDALRRQAARAGPCVEFLGFVSEQDKVAVLASSDVFVQLSLREGLSIATLEAMACGLPCLVSDIEGVREPITPGHDGFLVSDPTDVEQVVAAIGGLDAARDDLERLGRNARQTAEERYSVERMTAAYRKLYAEIGS